MISSNNMKFFWFFFFITAVCCSKHSISIDNCSPTQEIVIKWVLQRNLVITEEIMNFVKTGAEDAFIIPDFSTDSSNQNEVRNDGKSSW